MTGGPSTPDLLIEVVGIDGAGKSTVVGQVCRRLAATPRKVAPYSAEFHDLARSVGRLLGSRAEAGLRGCAVASALIAEARLPRSPIDVFDRYLEGARMFFAVHHLAPLPDDVLAALPAPDLVVLLDLPVELALSRRARPSCPDLDAERAYLHACADHLRAAGARHGWHVIDARRPLDEVVGEACQAVRAAGTRAARPAAEVQPATAVGGAS